MLAPWLARKKWQGKIGLPLRLTKPYRLGLLNWSAMPAFFPLIQKVLELTRYVLEIDEFRILLLSPRDCPPPKTEDRTTNISTSTAFLDFLDLLGASGIPAEDSIKNEKRLSPVD
jgi:hypothetical protein